MLSIEQQAEVLTLYYNDKRSVRSIARQMGVNRDTVQRLILRRQILEVKPAGVRSSILDPFKVDVDFVLRTDPFCTATAMLNRLRAKGYVGGVTVVREYLRKKKIEVVRPRQAFLRLEFAAGECAQVDWGEFGDVFGDGIKHHCFAMVLAHALRLSQWGRRWLRAR